MDRRHAYLHRGSLYASAVLLGLAPMSVPFWATGADSRTKAAFIAVGLGCWAVALLALAGMGGADVHRSRRNTRSDDEIDGIFGPQS